MNKLISNRGNTKRGIKCFFVSLVFRNYWKIVKNMWSLKTRGLATINGA